MSREMEMRVRKHSRGRPSDKLLLTYLAQQDFGNGIFALMENLAADMGIQVRGVQKCLAVLKALGEVEVDERRGRSSAFRITLECPDDCSKKTDHGTHSGEDPRPTGHPTPVPQDTPPPSHRTPIKSLEGSSSLRKKKGWSSSTPPTPAAATDPVIITLLAERDRAVLVEQTRADGQTHEWIGRLVRCRDASFLYDLLDTWRADGRDLAVPSREEVSP